MDPVGMAFGYWHFAEPHVTDITFDVEIGANIEQSPGRFYQLYQGKMRGVGFYLGFQTDVWHPSGQWCGHGLIFSRWESADASNAQLGANGWLENSPVKEGGFVGVRIPLGWTVGRYVCTLRPSETDAVGTWYDFRIKAIESGIETLVGGLRFPEPGIDSGGITWIEAYPGVKRLNVAADSTLIPETDFRVNTVTANGGAIRPSRCDTHYNQDFDCSDAWLHNGQLILRSGREVRRVHPAQSYAID